MPTLSMHVADQINATADNDDRRNGPKYENGHTDPSGQFDVQTLTVFMPLSASALVL